ncbi:MAG: 23S rRNA (adenine(2503)-C(2))-methyltransferase RlmN [Pseudomonadota bacterium]
MNPSAAINLLDYNTQTLGKFFTDLGERSFRAEQVLKWIHQKRVTEFSQMTNLSQALRASLAEKTEIRPPQVIRRQISSDGTRKWLLAVDDANQVETVFIPEKDRGTLCISSQVGCPLDCQFCATAKQGFNRNLSAGEIIGQLWLAAAELEHDPHAGRRIITNIVMMGMGEPLLNFDNVTSAMNLMLDDNAYGLGKKRVTLSTAGIVPGIDRLKDSCPVSLAVSLHAARDELRDEIVPINRKYPLASLMAACHRYADANPHSEITFEYVMLDGINDTLADAKQIVRLLEGLPAKVNLIPFNPFPGAAYRRSDDRAIDAFRDRLLRSGTHTITRKTRGDDIDAACGQLVGKVLAKGAKHRAKQAALREHH